MNMLVLLQLLFLPSGPQSCDCEAHTAAKAANDQIVITEIMQNPAAVADSSGEWFEVFNSGTATANLNGWTIKDNDTDSHVISADVFVASGAYVVLGNNSNSLTNGGATVAYQFSGITLANGADELILVRPDTTTADEVWWDGGPTFPDPSGASMELTSVALDNNMGASWSTATAAMSGGDSGTPGSGPDVVSAGNLVVTEIMKDPNAVADGSGEWFEVFNPDSTAVNMNGWTIRDNGTDSHVVATDVIVPAGGYIVLGNNAVSGTNGGITVAYQYSGFTLANAADEVVLVRGDATIADEVAYDGGLTFPDPVGASMELTDVTADNNLGANWADATSALPSGDLGTPGAVNGGGGGGGGVSETAIISEIMKNPNAVADSSGEWFEVYNPGPGTLNLNGWTIRDNGSDSHLVVGDVNIAAGSYAVLGINGDSGTNGGIAVAYQYSGFLLANSADEVLLIRPDSTIADEVDYDGTFPSPTGASMELTSTGLDNNVGANWATATNALPSGDLATPGSGPGGGGGGNGAPVVDAGAGQSFIWDTNPVVTNLNGSASDPESDPLTLVWTLTNGNAANVTITSPGSAVSSVTLTALGLYTFQLSADDGTTISVDTTSINVRDAPVSNGIYTTYFGNLHAHSTYSDGNKDKLAAFPDAASGFRYARDNGGLDYLLMSEHNHATAGMAIADYHSGVTEATTVDAESANFAAIMGMEWGTISSGGHVILSSDLLWGWEAGNYDVLIAKGDYDALFNQISAVGGFAQLCHPASSNFGGIFNNPYNAVYDDAVGLVTVKSGPAFSTATDYSNPSTSNYLSRYYDLLKLGYHVGPAADQDTHYANWGLANEQRTAILAEDLTQASLLAALKAGRVYATTDRNVQVNYTATYAGLGYSMSTVLTVGVGETVSFDVSVVDPDLESTTLIELMHGTVGGTTIASVATANTDTLIHNFTPTTEGENHFYFVIVTQADGQQAWTAPVWVETVLASGNVAPVAAFTSGTTNLTANFSDGSSDSDGTISGWSWDFGDTQSSTVQSPSHGYASAGTYTVTLTVTDNVGGTGSVSNNVTVSSTNVAPTANFTSSTTDLTANFTDTSSDSDGTVTGWSWDFGDTQSSTLQNPSHGYAAAGTYTVTLTVTDNSGGGNSVSQNVTVTASPTGWTIIDSNDFELGWGIWNDGGGDCRRSASDAAFAHQGTYCVRLRDNSGAASSMTTDAIDLSGYSQLRIQFWFNPISFENSEDIFVEVSTNGGGNWITVANYVNGIDFTNGFEENPEIIDTGLALGASTLVRIRCDASSNNDKAYIDEVVISAQ